MRYLALRACKGEGGTAGRAHRRRVRYVCHEHVGVEHIRCDMRV